MGTGGSDGVLRIEGEGSVALQGCGVISAAGKRRAVADMPKQIVWPESNSST